MRKVTLCQSFQPKIAPKAFPDCLSTTPNERDIKALMAALDITDKDEYLLAINKTIPFTLSGKGFKRAKDDDGNYVLSGNQIGYQELLEQSKTKDIIWFPNPVDTNAYGRTNKHFKTFKNIVVESDDKSLEEQWEQIRWLSSLGIQVTSVVYTGGKSLHHYFHLSESTDGHGYLTAKKALVMLLGADTNVSLVEKSRLPGLHRPGKEYPQQLIYNTANTTSVEAILEVFKAVFNRDITDDLWNEYKLARAGKSVIEPDKVLHIPDQQLPSVIDRKNRELDAERRRLERLAAPCIDRENYYKSCLEAINQIDNSATLEDFVHLGFVVKRSSPNSAIGSFNQGGKGQSCSISKPKNGDCLVVHSFKGDILANGKSSATYSQIWFERNGYRNLTGKDFYEAVKAIAADHSIILPDAPSPPSPSIIHPDAPPPPSPSSIIRTTFIPPEGSTTVNARFLSPELLALVPSDTKIVAIKSSWGTGKSTLMKEVVNQCVSNGDIYVMLSPLQSLARNSAIKLDVHYKTEYVSGVKLVSMCLHNLYDGSAIGARLLPVIRQHTKVHIVFDEAECLRKGLLAVDSTLAKNQLSIIDAIGELGSLPGARIWLLDADLSGETTDFYSDCIRNHRRLDAAEEIKTHWIVNEYENRIRTLFQYPLVNRNGKQSDPSVIFKHVLESAKNNPEMVLLAATGQKINSETGTFSAEAARDYLNDHGLDGKVLVVDSETTAVEGSLAAGIIEDPSSNLKIAKDRGFKVVIFTLGIFKTGLSIEDGEDRLFSHVFVISTGLLSPELVIQALFRYRNMDVPRYLFVRKSGFNYLADKAMTTSKAISTLGKDKIEALYARSIDISAPNRCKGVIHWLVDQWSKTVVDHNHQMTYYADTITELLQHAVETIITKDEDESGLDRLEDPATEVRAYLKKDKEDKALVNAISVTEERDLTHTEAEILKSSNKKTKEQNRQLNKHFLQNVTGRKSITVEDVFNGDKGYFTSAKKLYHATLALELLPVLDKLEISKIVDGNPLRIAKKVKYHKAVVLRKVIDLGLKNILFSDSEISSTSPSLITLVDNMISEGLLTTFMVGIRKRGGNYVETTYYSSAGDLVDLIGTITFKSKTDVLKKLLSEVGATLVLEKNNSVRTYRIKSAWEDVEGNHSNDLMAINHNLFNHWLKQDLATVLSHLTGVRVTPDQAISTLIASKTEDLIAEDYLPVRSFLNHPFSIKL